MSQWRPRWWQCCSNVLEPAANIRNSYCLAYPETKGYALNSDDFPLDPIEYRTIDTWHSKPLGDGMWANIPSEEIKRIFRLLFISAGEPAEMAVFSRLEEGRLHCEVVAYFSPLAGEVAKAVGARPCGKPAREGLKLLSGSDECWFTLFENR